MKRTTHVCDRCGTEAAGELDRKRPEGWAEADIRFHGLPDMRIYFLDLCGPCQDDLKRVWNEWLNPSPERIELAKDETIQWWARSKA
jgi:hypothetical protein